MKVKNLTSALKLINKISNHSSLTSLYRSVELQEDFARAISEFGNIHVLLAETTGLKNPVLIETQALLSISSSLSPESDINLEEKVNHIAWDCKKDEAKGKLNFVVTDHTIPEIDHTQFPWTPPKEFGKCLNLATSACQAAAVSFGLYGISVEPVDDKIHMMSSNTISLAATQIDKGDFPDKKFALRPPIPSIISSILEACPTSTIDICDDGIYIRGEFLLAHLPLGVNLDHDLKAIADKYTCTNKVIAVNSPSVKRFVTRARNLTEKQVSFTVSLKIEEGKLLLEHKGISSSSEQYFIAEGLDATLNYQVVSLPADLLMLALENVDRVVCDYLDQKQLILRGSNPDFLYVIGGN